MEKGITFVGLDAHKAAINVAMLMPEDGAGGVGVRKREGICPADVEEDEAGGSLRAATPCRGGFERRAAECVVVAPSLIPKKPGDRIKKRAPHPEPAAVEDVRVDHRGADVAMAKQFLDRAQVVAGLQQVGREAVPQGMAACGLRPKIPEFPSR